MSVKLAALAVLTVGGVGAVLALNPVDARSGSPRAAVPAAADVSAAPLAPRAVGEGSGNDIGAGPDVSGSGPAALGPQPPAAGQPYGPPPGSGVDAVGQRLGERPSGANSFDPRGPHRRGPRYVPPVGSEDERATGEERHDFSDDWEDEGGWHGRWDDHVRRDPHPQQSPLPRHTEDGDSQR